MCADIYTVGLAVDSSQLERGTQQARTALQGLAQTESQLEKQTKQTEDASKALGQTETALARSIAATEQAARQQGTAMDTLGQRTTTSSQGTKAFTSGLQAMLGPLASVQGAAVALGGYLSGQFIRSVLETAGRMQTLQLSLDAIAGSTRAGAEAMLFARQTAQQFGLATAEVADTYRGFLANTNGLNLGITTTNQLFTGLIATTKLVGGSTETLQNAVRGLTQTFAIGQLDAENWKGQVEEALPILGTALPRALGLTRQAFMEQMASGQLTIDRVLRPLVQVLGEQIPKAAGIAATSMESASARMGNSWRDLMTAIGQSSLVQDLLSETERLVRWSHDFLATMGAVDPRPASAIQQITERIADLQTRVNFEGRRSVETQEELNELTRKRAALLTLEAQQQQAMAQEEDKRRTAMATGPTGVTQTLQTQIDQDTAAMQRRYTVGRTVGIPQLERERAKLADLQKALQEQLDVLASTTPMTDADRKAREAHAIAVQDQIEAQEGLIKRLQEEERERNKPQREARRGRGGLTEEQRAANDVQREQNQLIDELVNAYDRATQSAAGLLAIRARRLKFTESEIQELLHNQALTQEAEKQNQAAQEAQRAYESSLETLQHELDVLQHAQEMGVSLEQAREEIALSLVARTDEELQTLIAMNDQRRQAVTLMDDENQRLQALASTAALMIEEEVRGPDPERASHLERVRQDFDLLQEAADTFASSFLEEITRVTEGAAFSFTRFAQSAIRDLTRILQQQFLMPQLASWGQKALGWGLGLLGAATGAAGAGTTLAPGTTALAGASGGSFFGSAVGGPLRSGVTLVGEAGPEAVVSRGGRSVVFPTSHPLTRMAVRAHLPGRQFGGPLPSMMAGSGEPQQAEKPAMPGQVPAGTRGVNIIFNITTPDASSFVRSRGEIERAMGQAVRRSQYAT